MAEYNFYTYSFTMVHKIECCSGCPFGENSLEYCKLYSAGIPSRCGYKEYRIGKPDWCKLKPMIRNGEGSYDIYEPPDKEITKYVMEVFLKSYENMARLKWTNKKNGE